MEVACQTTRHHILEHTEFMAQHKLTFLHEEGVKMLPQNVSSYFTDSTELSTTREAISCAATQEPLSIL
jgi:hypothetical protein